MLLSGFPQDGLARYDGGNYNPQGTGVIRTGRAERTGKAIDLDSMQPYLAPGRFIDSDHPDVVAFAAASSGAATDADVTRALRLYAAVRDSIRYEVYLDFRADSTYRASAVLQAGYGFCVGKAALLAACARALGIPARVGYADVRNHMTSPRMRATMGTDLFVWHSFTELWLDGKWVKATPAFDAGLCARIGLAPLEFDGHSDSLFHAYDREGRRHMEYVTDRGSYADVPAAVIISDMCALYPGLIEMAQVKAEFRSEAVSPDS